MFKPKTRMAGLLGKGKGITNTTGGKAFSGALERGSVAAVSAITNAGGNPLSVIEKNTKDTADKLSLVERNTAAAARRTAGAPLRPSNLRGGGAK